ncbi:MAG: hypothetical protein QNK82_03305 [Akkermansiaceae bacterium]|mgnify:FL=1|jgi:hypothetical protein|tara:strand:- start:2722 stop:3234 length:513 start_codon:yes stop_codon:yes gene_type:complete
MEDLISANTHLLNQAEQLLAVMADHDYADPVGNLYGSTLGQHLRHCLDHYSSFLNGLPDASIDYDHRERAESLECSTGCALEEIKRLKAGLGNAKSFDVTTRVKVKMDCGGGDHEWHLSTLGRELQFLVSHTVHHFAMINGMCRQRGLPMEEGFGIAPSTLRHRQLANID